MEVLGIIPSRYASTRFPGKPLAEIAGKPMVQWVYQKAKSVYEYVFVATDDHRIAEVVKSFGGQVLMTSTHHTSGTDRCAEALHWLREVGAFDAVVNIQATSLYWPNHSTLLNHSAIRVFRLQRW